MGKGKKIPVGLSMLNAGYDNDYSPGTVWICAIYRKQGTMNDPQS